MTIKEIGKQVIEILSSNKGGSVPNEWIEWIKALPGQIIEILEDNHGTLGIPKEEAEAIAQTLLPDIIAFFETDEGKRIYEQWKQEQAEKNCSKEEAS